VGGGAIRAEPDRFLQRAHRLFRPPEQMQERVPQPLLGVVVAGARADRAAIHLDGFFPAAEAREPDGEHAAEAGGLGRGQRAGQRALARGDAVLAREVETLPRRRPRGRGGARGRGQQERRREQRAQNASLFTT